MSNIQEIHADILVDLQLQLEQESFKVSPEAVEIFKKLGIQIQRLPLENALHHGSPLVRGIAAKLLGRLKDSKAAHSLQQLRDDEDSWVRSMIYEALGNFPGVEISDFIAKGLSDSDWKVRGVATQVIAPYRHEASKDKLIELLKNDDSEEVKAAAARALSFFPDDTLRPVLFDATQSALPRTRAMALKALASKTPLAAYIPNIQEALKDPHPWVRASAAWCLQAWGSLGSIEVLKEAIQDSEWKVQEAITRALGVLIKVKIAQEEQSGSLDAIRQQLNSIWISKLEEKDLELSYIGALLESISLVRYALSEEQIEVIRKWTQNDTEQVRLLAYSILCNCASWICKDELLELLQTEEEKLTIKGVVLELLSRQKSFQEEKVLFNQLKTTIESCLKLENAWLVGAAILASSNLELKEFGDQVLSHLNHHNPDIRARVCQILPNMETSETVQALIYTLREDADELVRYHAAQALLTYCDQEKVQDALMYALNDEDVSVQISCSQTLCKAGYGRTMKTLQNVLKGEEEALKMATAKALQYFIHPDWVTWIEENAPQEKHPLIQEALLESLAILKKAIHEQIEL